MINTFTMHNWFQGRSMFIKKAGIHTFDVLAGNSIIAKELSFEMKKEGVSERKFF